MPTAEFSSSSSSSMRDFWNGAAAKREREGTLYCPFAAPGEKENYLRDGHESRRGSFPKLAPPDGRDGENSNYASGARKLNGREWHHAVLPHKKDAIFYPFCFPTTPPKTRRTWDREESLHHKMECKIFVLAAAASATLVPSQHHPIPNSEPSGVSDHCRDKFRDAAGRGRGRSVGPVYSALSLRFLFLPFSISLSLSLSLSPLFLRP